MRDLILISKGETRERGLILISKGETSERSDFNQ